MKDLFKPYKVQINPTYDCNLQCDYCISRLYGLNDDGVNLKKELIPQVVNFINKHAVNFPVVNISGGEPTLYPYLKELIYSIKEGTKTQVFNINTNLLNIDIFTDEFMDIISLLNVSIDGPKDLHESRRGNNFDTVTSNFQTLSDRGYLNKLAVSYIVTEQNISRLASTREYFNSLPVNITSFSLDYFNIIKDSPEFLTAMFIDLVKIIIAEESLDILDNFSCAPNKVCCDANSACVIRSNGLVTHCGYNSNPPVFGDLNIGLDIDQKLVDESVELTESVGCYIFDDKNRFFYNQVFEIINLLRSRYEKYK